MKKPTKWRETVESRLVTEDQLSMTDTDIFVRGAISASTCSMNRIPEGPAGCPRDTKSRRMPIAE